MGGIAIDCSDAQSFLLSSDYAALTPQGIGYMLRLEPHLLPDISAEDVKDRSKASSFTKFLACVQATWFCLSCLGRVAQRLPVSMLELNTFAHALCTVVVYVIVSHSSFPAITDVVGRLC